MNWWLFTRDVAAVFGVGAGIAVGGAWLCGKLPLDEQPDKRIAADAIARTWVLQVESSRLQGELAVALCDRDRAEFERDELLRLYGRCKEFGTLLQTAPSPIPPAASLPGDDPADLIPAPGVPVRPGKLGPVDPTHTPEAPHP